MGRLTMGTPTAKRPAQLRLRVSATAEKRLRSGHPWLFAQSVREQNREGELGEIAVVYDRNDRFLAFGLFDPLSALRLRVLHVGAPVRLERVWWDRRLQRALEKRQALFDEKTTGYRLINGESDGWPGLVLDRYGSTLVLKIYTGAWLPRLKETAELIQERLRPERIVLRLSRKLQGTSQHRAYPCDGEVLQGQSLTGTVRFLESGIQFEADVLRGQKTGFFLDQRENRRKVEGLAAGRTLLNAFSFSGGYSLYAARGHAQAMTDLDISPHALAGSRNNFSLNNSTPAVKHCVKEWIQADAFKWLSENSRRQFGLVILDPPSMAKRESERFGAIRAYARLVSLGLEHLSRGGLLLASSCSAHVTGEEFFTAVRDSARKTGRRFKEIETTGHAPDHPASFSEALYLKSIYLKFE